MGQNWSPWSEFSLLTVLISAACEPRQRSYRNTVTMTTLWDCHPLNFLYSTLLCQMCFKCSLLQATRAAASAGIREKRQKKKKPTEETHARQLMHAHTARSHSHSHHRLWERILKVCFTKLGRGGRIFSFSPSSGRCVFARERQRGRRREREWSSAGQVISLSQWESTPWNSPREAGKAAFIIFLFYYCQNSLYFTFCSWRPFLLILVSVPFECFGSSGVFGATPPPRSLVYLPILKVHRAWNQRERAPDVEALCGSRRTGSECNHMLQRKWTTGTRPGPALQSISACTTLILGWKRASGNISWTNMVIILRCFWERRGGEKKKQKKQLGGKIIWKTRKHLADLY